jgi:hypothetical protein
LLYLIKNIKKEKRGKSLVGNISTLAGVQIPKVHSLLLKSLTFFSKTIIPFSDKERLADYLKSGVAHDITQNASHI